MEAGQTTTPAASGGGKSRSKTGYVVLKRELFAHGEDDHVDCWLPIGAADAHNRRSALQKVLAGVEPQNGDVYQVVPARSFQPVTVSVVTPAPEVKFDGLD